MRNKNTTKLHRLNVNLTDGEYFTLQNLANFYNLTVSDYVKKSCGIIGIMPQREFVPVWNREEKKIELIDDTPEPVQWGDMTLREYYELNEENHEINKQSQWELEQAIKRGEVDIENL